VVQLQLAQGIAGLNVSAHPLSPYIYNEFPLVGGFEVVLHICPNIVKISLNATSLREIVLQQCYNSIYWLQHKGRGSVSLLFPRLGIVKGQQMRIRGSGGEETQAQPVRIERRRQSRPPNLVSIGQPRANAGATCPANSGSLLVIARRRHNLSQPVPMLFVGNVLCREPTAERCCNWAASGERGQPLVRNSC